MTDAGWIKAHRTMLDHPLLKRADVFAVWMRLLLMAAHEPSRIMFRGRQVMLGRGQAAVSMHALGAEIGVTPKRLRAIACRLLSDGCLKMDQAEGKAFTIVTICNYDVYQAPADDGGQSQGQTKGKGRAKVGQTEQESKNPESTGALPSPSRDTESGPSGRVFDSAKAHLWDEMKARVGGKRPGAVVARWCADYGDGETFASHFEAEAKNPADYVSFMVATLKRRAADKPRSAKGERRSLLEQSANILNGVNGHAGPGHPGAGETAPLHPAISPPDVRRV